MSDDQAWSTFNRSLMPNVFSQLVDQGALFTRAYDSTSKCCPSRSEILTGLYEHHTGVDENTTPLDRPTIVQALHDLGYRTGLFGKYLNSWPCDPRAEFDRWVCMGSGLSSYSLKNPTLNVDGTWTGFTGYTTDILASFAAGFMNSTPVDQPFFAMYSPTSPHQGARAARLPPAPPRRLDHPPGGRPVPRGLVRSEVPGPPRRAGADHALPVLGPRRDRGLSGERPRPHGLPGALRSRPVRVKVRHLRPTRWTSSA